MFRVGTARSDVLCATCLKNKALLKVIIVASGHLCMQCPCSANFLYYQKYWDLTLNPQPPTTPDTGLCSESRSILSYNPASQQDNDNVNCFLVHKFVFSRGHFSVHPPSPWVRSKGVGGGAGYPSALTLTFGVTPSASVQPNGPSLVFVTARICQPLSNPAPLGLLVNCKHFSAAYNMDSNNNCGRSAHAAHSFQYSVRGVWASKGGSDVGAFMKGPCCAFLSGLGHAPGTAPQNTASRVFRAEHERSLITLTQEDKRMVRGLLATKSQIARVSKPDSPPKPEKEKTLAQVADDRQILKQALEKEVLYVLRSGLHAHPPGLLLTTLHRRVGGGGRVPHHPPTAPGHPPP